MKITIIRINLISFVSLTVMDGKKLTSGNFGGLQLFRASSEGFAVFGKTAEDACEFLLAVSGGVPELAA